jgi:hypothetical protein
MQSALTVAGLVPRIVKDRSDVHGLTIPAGSAAAQAAVRHAAVGAHAVTAAGDELLQLLNQLMTTLEEAAAAGTSMQQPRIKRYPAAQLQQLWQQLQEFGTAMCAALPVRFCCNNVQCSSLAGLSEQQQVAGKHGTCSGCYMAR